MTEPLTDEQRAMVEANMGLCGWVIQRYYRHLPPAEGSGYTQADAHQDAALGLIRAVRKYDPTKGFKFSTYATTWLRNHINRGMGDFEGINHRRVRRYDQTVTDDEVAQVLTGTLSLNVTLEDGDEMGTLIADPADPWSESAQRLLLVEIRNARGRVCRDDIDRAILDGITDITEHRSQSAVFDEIGKRHGITREAVRNRFIKIRRELTRLLDGVAA